MRRLAIAIGLVVLFVACVHPTVFDYDVWFDLAMGEHIVHTGAIPHHSDWVWPNDRLPQPWFPNDELGFCVLARAVHHAFGEYGLALLLTALPAWGCLVLGTLTARRRGAGWGGAALAAVLGALLLQSRLMPRPQLITDLFLAAFVYMGERERTPPWAYAALMLVWCNLHAGCFIGVAWLGLRMVADLIAGVVERARAARESTGAEEGDRAVDANAARGLLGLSDGAVSLLRRDAGALALTLAATVCCPAGFWLAVYFVDHIFVHNRGLQLIAEWAPAELCRNPLTLFVALEIAGLAALGAARGLRPRDVLVFVVFAWAAKSRSRSCGELVATNQATLALGLSALGALAPELLRRALARISPRAFAILAAVAAAACLVWLAPQRLPLRAARYAYPDEALAFIARRGLPTTVFNTFHFGGYMTWRARPAYRAFIHGFDPTYDEQLFDDYIVISRGGREANATLDRWGVQVMLVGYGQPDDITGQLLTWLQVDPGWKLVWFDDTALVYVRRTSAFASLPAFDTLRPGAATPWEITDSRVRADLVRAAREMPSVRGLCGLADALAAAGDGAGASQACARAIAIDAEHPLPHSTLGRLKVGAGDLEGGKAELETAWRLAPSASLAYNIALAEARAAHVDETTRWLGEALRLDPAFTPARDLARKAGLSVP